MNENIYLGVNPIVRVLETRLLKKDFFDQMINAKDFFDSLNILKSTVYGNYFVEENYNFDEILDVDYSNTLRWAYEVGPQKELINLHSLAITYHNLKVATKAKWLSKNLDQIFLDDARFLSSDFKVLIETGKSSVFPETTINAANDILNYIEEYKTIEAVDIIYDRHYISEIKKESKLLGHEYLRTIMKSKIDLINLSTLFTALVSKRKNPSLSAELSSSGSIPKETLLNNFGSLEIFLNYLKETKYEKIIDESITEEGIFSASRFFVISDNYLTTLYKKAKLEVFGPLPLAAYLRAKEIEIKNIRLILTCKKNNISNEIIQERLRECYVL